MKLFERIKRPTRGRPKQVIDWYDLKSYAWVMPEYYAVGVSKSVPNIIEGGSDIVEVCVAIVRNCRIMDYNFYPVTFYPEPGTIYYSQGFIFEGQIVFLQRLNRIK